MLLRLNVAKSIKICPVGLVFLFIKTIEQLLADLPTHVKRIILFANAHTQKSENANSIREKGLADPRKCDSSGPSGEMDRRKELELRLLRPDCLGLMLFFAQHACKLHSFLPEKIRAAERGDVHPHAGGSPNVLRTWLREICPLIICLTSCVEVGSSSMLVASEAPPLASARKALGPTSLAWAAQSHHGAHAKIQQAHRWQSRNDINLQSSLMCGQLDFDVTSRATTQTASWPSYQAKIA